MTSPAFTLRPATPQDVPAIVGMIRELAEFERLEHLMEATPERLAAQLFGERPAAEAMVAVADDVADGAAAGYALFFPTFSTFLARPGLWLEDLYVRPAWRSRGLGRALLARVAALAAERDCGRLEWSVLDWNRRAIALYEGMGATVMPDWRICRVTGERLAALAAGGDAAAEN
ncbi:GNAT family N-acetyltransferase [Xenophilus sp.]|uniref:GNAT family N-acetyltransferase n=1 Tax=Xenophilus sp. TaxID=1873499 RepID=UPI0037DD5D15